MFSLFNAPNPANSSAVKSIRLKVSLIRRITELSKERGQSVNSILVNAVEAGLPKVEAELRQ